MNQRHGLVRFIHILDLLVRQSDIDSIYTTNWSGSTRTSEVKFSYRLILADYQEM